MDITVNGKKETVSDCLTIESFIVSKNISPAHVVVELNKEIVQKEMYASRKLETGDVLEIVRFVGGG